MHQLSSDQAAGLEETGHLVKRYSDPVRRFTWFAPNSSSKAARTILSTLAVSKNLKIKFRLKNNTITRKVVLRKLTSLTFCIFSRPLAPV